MKIFTLFFFFLNFSLFAGKNHKHPGRKHLHPQGEEHSHDEHSHGDHSHSDHSHDNYGHSHGLITKSKTILKGRDRITKLISSKKIDASWIKAEHLKSEMIDFNKKKEWKVIFTNKHGVKEKKLYIFLKPDGKFVAANFTGK